MDLANDTSEPNSSRVLSFLVDGTTVLLLLPIVVDSVVAASQPFPLFKSFVERPFCNLVLFAMFSWLASTEGDNDDASGDSTIQDETNDAAAETTTTTTNNATPSKRCRTWKTAFRDTCLQNNTIHASIVQVLEEFAVDESQIPTASTAFYFHQDGSNQKLVEDFQQSQTNDNTTNSQTTTATAKEQQEARQSSSLAYIVDKVVGATKYAARYVFSTEDDILMEQAGYDPHGDKHYDSYAANGSNDNEQVLDASEAILNMDLAVECLVFLRDIITRYASNATATDQPQQAILALPGGASTAPSVCQEWITSQILENAGAGAAACGSDAIRNLIRQMARQDLNFLVQALLAGRVMEIIQRRPQQDDLLVFTVGEDGESSASSKEVKVAMFDLGRQINSIQTRIDTLTERKEKCETGALRCRRNKQERQALQHMNLRKKLDQEISLSQSKIHNLEDQRMALENASSNFEILQVSQQTAKTLKKIREQTENADDVILDLQEEIDTNKDIQETLTPMGNMSGVTVEEDELLAELQALSIDDTTPGGSGAPNAHEQPAAGSVPTIPPPSESSKGATTDSTASAFSSESAPKDNEKGTKEQAMLVEG